MNDLFLMQDTPTLLSGIAAAVLLTSAPAFRSRRMILLVQLAAALAFTMHYFCLGIAVAGAVNILCAVQTAAALLSAKSAAMHRLGYALIGLMALVGFWFWQGPISALSVAATILIAVGRMQANELNLRVLLLAGGCFWAMHDFAAQAWIAFGADVGALAIGAVALLALLIRVTIEWRPNSSAPFATAA
ncbi:MAG: YgjV family protein [Sulfitobacter sp.]